MARGSFVCYLRVSTQQQGRSGLGLEAQRKAVDGRLDGGDWKLVARFMRSRAVTRARRSDRPQLAGGAHLLPVDGRSLVVANVSRLTRDPDFMRTLADAGVAVEFCDMPNVEGRRPIRAAPDALGRRAGGGHDRRADEEGARAAKRGVREPGEEAGRAV